MTAHTSRLHATPFIPGETCAAVAHADRVSVLIDGKAYFSALKRAFAAACRQIVIVGWDFDSDVLLEPDSADMALGGWLRHLVESKPDLHVCILIWRNSLLYGSNDEPLMPFGKRWWRHPRIAFHLDSVHPPGASHHQKIVCIDGGLAFCGGMDITQRRWDDDHHRLRNRNRHDENGDPARPVHDVQVALDGEAARTIWSLISRRWERKTGRPLPMVRAEPIWPDVMTTHFADQDVAISVTRPKYRGEAAARQIEALNIAMLSKARRCIYIETQYFALKGVADILARHLANPTGPEIVIVTNEQWQGWIEKTAMGGKRTWLLSKLAEANIHDRLGFFFPVTGGEKKKRIKVHSKVLITDDLLLRVGSSNLNERSMSLDTECDISLQASGAASSCVAFLRNRLIAEHLGQDAEEFAAQVARHGSILAAIRQAPRRDRALLPFPPVQDSVAVISFLGNLLDPGGPMTWPAIWAGLWRLVRGGRRRQSR